MKHLKTVALVLICLLLFAGCQEAPIETTPPTEAPTTAPTEPSPADIYTQAASALQESENLLLHVSVDQTIEVSGQTYTTQSTQTITYLNYGTEQLRASVKENVSFCDYNSAFTELYADGKVYTSCSGNHYITDLTDGNYTQLHIPAVLLDATLYGSVVQEGDRFLFSQATALESWAVPDGTELIDASGAATLDGNGKLASSSYSIEYQYGPSKITENYTVTISVPTVTEISVPEDTSGYIPCDGVGALWLYERANSFLKKSDSVSSQILASTISSAAAITLIEQTDVDCYPDETASMYRVNQSINYNYHDGSDSYELEETYRNGIYTAVKDGGEPQETGIPLALMQNHVMEVLMSNALNIDTFAEISCTDTGTLYLLEIKTTEEYVTEIRGDICYILYQDSKFLDNLASNYETTSTELYFSIDKYTGTPVAIGMYYEGVHTIDGQKYTLIQQVDQTFSAPSTTAYHTITDENLPEAEPEEKATPLFYHVTGTNGQEMWLFGTIHVGDERTAYLPQEIYNAFDSSDALAIECDTDGFEEKLEGDDLIQSLVSSSYYYMGSTIDKHLDTPELYDHAKQLMKATGNYFFNSEYMKAYLWGNSIDNYYLGQGRQLSSEQGVEERLTQRAEEKEIPLREVESVLFQIQMMGSYSPYLQEFLLYNAVASDGQANWESTMELYEMWCSGDEAVLIEYLNDDEPWELAEEDFDMEGLTEEELAEVNDILSRLDEINAELAKIETEYNISMSTNRNAGMLEVAKEYLESGDVVFYAVGLAHLLAEDGLVNTLRDAGYTVELVKFA